LARDLFQALKAERLQMGRQLALEERQFELERQRYEAGRISATEFSTHEQSLLNVRLESLRLTHALVAPLLDLAEARGILDLETLFL
jgi:outer membrane protein TolC